MNPSLSLILAQFSQPKRVGHNWMVLCCFHDDSKPSLAISELGYYCHSNACNESGSLARLARELGVDLPYKPSEPDFIYTYRDRDGNAIGEICKWCNGKTCARQYLSAGEYQYDWKGVRRELYRLNEIVGSAHDSILLAEGEKDVETLRLWGFLATTAPFGSKAKWEPQYTETLKGFNVLILPDNDEAGLKRADAVMAVLAGVCPTVRVIRLPDLPPGGDVTDWKREGGTKERLGEIIDKTLGSEKNEPEEGPNPYSEASETLLELMGSEITQPKSFLGDGLFVEYGLSILVGRPGTGKTWAAAQLALALAQGEQWFGIETVACNVGLLELELPRYYLKSRIEAIIDTKAIEALGKIHTITRPNLGDPVDLSLEATAYQIAAWTSDIGLDLLIIDPFAQIHNLDERTSQDIGLILANLQIIRNYGQCHILLIHHEPKGADTSKDRASHLDKVRGHSRLQSDPQTIMRLCEERGSHMIVFPKTNLGPTPDPIWLDRQEHGPFELREEPSTMLEVADERRALIKKYLKEAGIAGISNESIRNRLEKAGHGLTQPTVTRRLQEMGAERSHGDNKWRLKEEIVLHGTKSMDFDD